MFGRTKEPSDRPRLRAEAKKQLLSYRRNNARAYKNEAQRAERANQTGWTRAIDEARAYLGHAILGPRLMECIEAVMGVSGRTLHEIFGSPDDIMFRSSMTLFATANGHGNLFRQALDRYCGGQMDPATLDLLGVKPH